MSGSCKRIPLSQKPQIVKVSTGHCPSSAPIPLACSEWTWRLWIMRQLPPQLLVSVLGDPRSQTVGLLLFFSADSICNTLFPSIKRFLLGCSTYFPRSLIVATLIVCSSSVPMGPPSRLVHGSRHLQSRIPPPRKHQGLIFDY